MAKAKPKQDDSLKRVVELAQVQVRLQKRVEELEAELSQANQELARVKREDLPELMLEVGVTSLTLEDGSEVVLQDDVICSLSEAAKPAAFAWLRSHNFDGIIKGQVLVPIERGAFATGEKLDTDLHRLGFNSEFKLAVHPATLKSFVKERMAAGVDVPPADLFGIYPFRESVIKRAKRKG